MLKTTKVEEFWDSEVRAVIEISSKLTVAEGFQRLLDNNVLSAPVFDEDDNHKYVGFLDLRDIVSWAVFLFDEDVDPAVDLLDVINAGQRYFKQQGLGKITVKYLSKMNPFHSVKEGSLLEDAVSILKTGVKRVPILNSENRVSGLISQASLNKYFVSHIDMFKEKAEKSVVDAGVIMTPVYQVQCSEPAIEAFRVMDNRKLSCICVVSPDGAIAGCFTSRGLKEFVKKPRRSSLLLPMCEFLAEVSKPTEPVVVCRKEDTVVTVMKLMAEKNVHRVYVVDEANKPVGIIALTDIMKYIAK